VITEPNQQIILSSTRTLGKVKKYARDQLISAASVMQNGEDSGRRVFDQEFPDAGDLASSRLVTGRFDLTSRSVTV
jgi:hypothetical protein